MHTRSQSIVVGVFHQYASAQKAIAELRRAGFHDDQLGVVGRDSGDLSRTVAEDQDSYVTEGALTGVAAGAGVGALWGLGIAAGVLGPIGPAVAAGTLATIFSSAAAGAAVAGVAGTLLGMGIAKEDADFYEAEFQAGHILVTVDAFGREADARSILRDCGASDSRRSRDIDDTLVTETMPYDQSTQGTSDGSSRAAGSGFAHHELDVPISAEDILDQKPARTGTSRR